MRIPPAHDWAGIRREVGPGWKGGQYYASGAAYIPSPESWPQSTFLGPLGLVAEKSLVQVQADPVG